MRGRDDGLGYATTSALRVRRCRVRCGHLREEQDRADHVERRWAIAPGHVPRGGKSWRVIEEHERFVIVEVEERDVPMT
jgi:hypothetical protein